MEATASSRSCCRICFDTEKTLLPLQTIVEFGGVKLTCLQMYQDLTKLQEPPEEMLRIVSQHICILCFGELNSCFKFQRKAIESFHLLIERANASLSKDGITCKDEDDHDEPSKEEEETNIVVGKIELEDDEIEIATDEVNSAEDSPPTDMQLEAEEASDLREDPSEEAEQATCEDYEEEFLDADFVETNSIQEDETAREEDQTQKLDAEDEPETNHEAVELNPSDENYNCVICSEQLESRSQLDHHFVTVHCQQIKDGSFICAVCNKEFGSKKTLRQHSRIHQDRSSRRFKCRFCSKAFNYGHHLRIHETTHTMEKPFSCLSCGKSFACKDRLKNHELQHVNDFDYSCNACSTFFRTKKTLKMHTILKHDASVENFESIRCDNCDKQLNSKSAASAHFRGTCGGGTTQQPTEQEISALVISAVSKEYSCEFCPQVFKSYLAFVIHRRKHSATTESGHRCPDCEESFTTLHDLENHQSQAHQKRPHTCEICGKSFKQIIVLQRHLKTHTGQRTFRCSLCPKSFAQQATLRNHENTHAEGCRFACSQCPKKYKFLASLRNHAKQRHGDGEQ